MFKKLFKPKWQVGSREERLAAIEKMGQQPEKYADTLQTIVKNDAEASVRNAALKCIADQEALGQLVKDCEFEDTKEAIHRHRVTLYKEGDLSQLSESDLLDVSLYHKVAKVRLAAAKGVDTSGLLEILIKDSNDKAVIRHARQELKVARAAEAQEQEKRAKIDDLCEQMEALKGRSGMDQFFLGKYENLLKHWGKAKVHASSAQEVRFDEAIAACLDEVNALQQAADEKKAIANAKEQLDVLVAQMEQHADALNEKAPTTDAVNGAVSELDVQWKDAKALAKPTEAQKGRYKKARQRLYDYSLTLLELHTHEDELQALINEIELFDSQKPSDIQDLFERIEPKKTLIQWPSGVAKPPLLVHWKQALNQMKQIERQRDQRAEDAVRELMRRRRQLDAHIEKGELKIANRVHAHIHHALENIWGRELERQKQRLAPLEEKLQKLRDWHGFSTEPKKEALCEQMEALSHADSLNMPPLERADAIKALQEEWREQTSVNIVEDDPLWTRFKEAGNVAFEPCAEYYQKQAELKQSNLQKRRELAQQLDDYYHSVNWADDSHIDWKKLQTIVRTARNEWKQYEPVRFPEARPVHDAFFKTVDAINEQLKTHWQSNLQEKETLIEKAKALMEEEDVQTAIDKAIFLQKQWKDVGATFRSREQKAWKAFRAACDDVFARRDAQREQQRAETNEYIKAAEQYVADMRDLSRLNDTELVKAQEQAETLQEQFAGVENLPEPVAKALGKKFNDARRAFELQLAGVAGRKRQAELESVAQLAQQCHTLEQVVLNAESVPVALNNEEQQQWDELQEQAESTVLAARIQVLAAALEQGKDALGNTKHHQESLEDLAIELEVLTDTETPTAFKAQRRVYQLDKLSDEMGVHKDAATVQREVEALCDRWYATGAIEQSSWDKLNQRLDNVLSRQEKRKAS